MPSLRRELEKLASLESFDPRVFAPDSGSPRELCDFVLGLALAFNDLKDLLLGHGLLLGDAPKEIKERNTTTGSYAGLHIHFVRVLAAFLHELNEYLRDNEDVIRSPAFQRLERTLPAAARKAWEAVQQRAAAKRSDDLLSKFVFFARNKVAYHYDRKTVGGAFRDLFPKSEGDRPMVSRGNSIASTRFYFADAAAEKYLTELLGAETVEAFFVDQPGLLVDIGRALSLLVLRFVEFRGGAWREESLRGRT